MAPTLLSCSSPSTPAVSIRRTKERKRRGTGSSSGEDSAAEEQSGYIALSTTAEGKKEKAHH